MDSLAQEGYTYIYALLDPRTQEVRYVGKSIDPPKRYLRHYKSDELKAQTYKARWLRGLKAKGLKADQVILQKIPNSEWEVAEQELIAYYKGIGCRITNATPGGDGRCAGFTHSAKTRAKMSASRKGKPRSPETIAKVAAGRRGKLFTDEQKKRLSEAHIGCWNRLSDEQRRNCTEGLRVGWQHRITPKSGYHGVARQGNRYYAMIQIGGKRHSLGGYATPEEAAKVYDAKAREVQGEYAVLNFP